MDVKRDPAILKKKQRLRLLMGAVAVVAIVAVSYMVSRLEPAAPSVASSAVYFGTVKRGSMVREVRGAGTLVPEDIRWIAATATGRVQRIVLRPGAHREAGHRHPRAEQSRTCKNQVNDADLSVKAAVAQFENARSNLKTTRMQQEINVADAKSAYEVALNDLEANKQLNAQGLVADLQIKNQGGERRPREESLGTRAEATGRRD